MQIEHRLCPDAVKFQQDVFCTGFLGVLLVWPIAAVGHPINVGPHGEHLLRTRAPGPQKDVINSSTDLVQEARKETMNNGK